MRDLLRELHEYGLKDLSFLIVNVNDPLSILLIGELQDRVPFPVYQETDDELVWNILEGGKDDMFVYDRCGRLTYYIPFPLSIIHEKQPIVKAAIFSTYFQAPCGQTCSPNTTFSIDLVEEQSNSIQNNDDILDEQIQTENSNNTSNATDNTDDSLVVAYVPDYYDIDGNFSWNDNNSISEAEKDTLGWNETRNETDAHSNPSDEGLLDSLLSFFGWRSETPSTTPTPITNNSLEILLDENNSTEDEKMHIHHHMESQNHVMNHTLNTTTTEKQKEIADRCQGADERVCRSWSKKRLLQAQGCCALHIDPDIPKPEVQSCRNYGKKRCKKIKIVLKCCLKTLFPHKVPEEIDASSESEETM